MNRGSIGSPAGDTTAAPALHFLYPAAYAKAEFDLQDAEVVDPQQTQQAAESFDEFRYPLAQRFRLPAPPREASPSQYTGNGIAGIGARDYVGAAAGRR